MMTFKTNLRSDWQLQDPGSGENSTCTLLPDPDSYEGAWLARLQYTYIYIYTVYIAGKKTYMWRSIWIEPWKGHIPDPWRNGKTRELRPDCHGHIDIAEVIAKKICVFFWGKHVMSPYQRISNTREIFKENNVFNREKAGPETLQAGTYNYRELEMCMYRPYSRAKYSIFWRTGSASCNHELYV